MFKLWGTPAKYLSIYIKHNSYIIKIQNKTQHDYYF